MALFSFVQAEFPWTLGPADGRYLLRDADEVPRHVVVLSTVGAARRRRGRGRRATRPATPEPAPVATARATVIESAPLTDEPAAREWLARADGETAHAGLDTLNRVLLAHRIAAADPAVQEVTAAQALVLRVGYGDGEAVAEGRWRAAREVLAAPRRVRRSAALRPQERLALLLGGRHPALAVEEFALRARRDFDEGRLLHAAWELRSAYEVGLPELRAEAREDLAARLAELTDLHDGVAAAARAGAPPPAAEPLRHALERLEAALRARTATGFGTLRNDHGGPVGTNPGASPGDGA